MVPFHTHSTATLPTFPELEKNLFVQKIFFSKMPYLCGYLKKATVSFASYDKFSNLVMKKFEGRTFTIFSFFVFMQVANKR